ncbi:hypothetical protein [Vulcanisaeta souniana]|uniref:hypothetical protein n=1 Tax=Vulcanisaeta souniana TaxID=164452 RepID=UPI00222E504D|nr:hypothetical protein [Vulcanisaeta souniana]
MDAVLLREALREGGQVVIMRFVKNGSQYIARPIEGFDQILNALAGVLVNTTLILDGGRRASFIARVGTYHGARVIYLPKKLNRIVEEYWREDRQVIATISVLE